MLLLTAGLLTFLIAALPWASTDVVTPLNLHDTTVVTVSGGTAAPAVSAAALVLLAAAIAVLLARRVAVLITCLVVAAMGVVVSWAATGVWLDPVSAVATAATKQTATLAPPTSATSAIWTIVAVGWGIALIVLAVLIGRAARTWKLDQRHERVPSTADGARLAPPEAAGRQRDGLPQDAFPDDDAVYWDRLSRGEDLTA